MALAYIDKVPRETAAFEAKVRAIAGRLGINPDWLMIVMYLETAGKFLPGLYASSNAVGLIQFTTAGASQVGTTKAYLASLTAVQQLDWVEKYFNSWKAAGRIKSLEDTWLVVFAPAYLGKPASTVVYRKGTDAYALNAAVDREKKGYITVGDIGATVRRFVPSGWVETTTGFSLGLVAVLAGGYFLYQRNRKQQEQE